MKLIKILFSSILFLSFFSCKKVIEIKETDFIGGDIALKTVENNEQGIVGAYAGLGIEMGILLNATFSDEVKKGEFYNAATTHEWQFSTTDISIRDNFTAFNQYYRIVDRVNRVLQALPNADSTKTGDEALRGKLKGEALFLRAFCHFELYRYYCANYDPEGLALAYMEVPSLNPQERIKMGPFFQKLNADLNESKSLLPNNLSDVGRASRLASTALQARVALYMRDWPSAITYSTEYINELPLSPRSSFNGIWKDENNNEVAFKLKRSTAAGGRIGNLFRGTSTKNAAGDTLIGTVTWLASDKIWASYDQANDVRFDSYFVDEPILIKANRPSHLINKYSGSGYTTSSENLADAKIFRTAEMVLIRAEARAETGAVSGANSAEEDLNNLRAVRISGYTNESIASKDEAISQIMLERFKELAYEGHRFWDLKRRNLPVDRLDSDAPTTTSKTLPANNFRFLLPIPDAEMKANKLIVQNPGYN